MRAIGRRRIGGRGIQFQHFLRQGGGGLLLHLVGIRWRSAIAGSGRTRRGGGGRCGGRRRAGIGLGMDGLRHQIYGFTVRRRLSRQTIAGLRRGRFFYCRLAVGVVVIRRGHKEAAILLGVLVLPLLAFALRVNQGAFFLGIFRRRGRNAGSFPRPAIR